MTGQLPLGHYRIKHETIQPTYTNSCSEAQLTDICPFVNKVNEILGKLGPQLCTMKSNLDTVFQVVQHVIQYVFGFASGNMISDVTIH